MSESNLLQEYGDIAEIASNLASQNDIEKIIEGKKPNLFILIITISGIVCVALIIILVSFAIVRKKRQHLKTIDHKSDFEEKKQLKRVQQNKNYQQHNKNKDDKAVDSAKERSIAMNKQAVIQHEKKQPDTNKNKLHREDDDRQNETKILPRRESAVRKEPRRRQNHIDVASEFNDQNYKSIDELEAKIKFRANAKFGQKNQRHQKNTRDNTGICDKKKSHEVEEAKILQDIEGAIEPNYRSDLSIEESQSPAQSLNRNYEDKTDRNYVGEMHISPTLALQKNHPSWIMATSTLNLKPQKSELLKGNVVLAQTKDAREKCAIPDKAIGLTGFVVGMESLTETLYEIERILKQKPLGQKISHFISVRDEKAADSNNQDLQKLPNQKTTSSCQSFDYYYKFTTDTGIPKKFLTVEISNSNSHNHDSCNLKNHRSILWKGGLKHLLLSNQSKSEIILEQICGKAPIEKPSILQNEIKLAIDLCTTSLSCATKETVHFWRHLYVSMVENLASSAVNSSNHKNPTVAAQNISIALVKYFDKSASEIFTGPTLRQQINFQEIKSRSLEMLSSLSIYSMPTNSGSPSPIRNIALLRQWSKRYTYNKICDLIHSTCIGGKTKFSGPKLNNGAKKSAFTKQLATKDIATINSAEIMQAQSMKQETMKQETKNAFKRLINVIIGDQRDDVLSQMPQNIREFDVNINSKTITIDDEAAKLLCTHPIWFLLRIIAAIVENQYFADKKISTKPYIEKIGSLLKKPEISDSATMVFVANLLLSEKLLPCIVLLAAHQTNMASLANESLDELRGEESSIIFKAFLRHDLSKSESRKDLLNLFKTLKYDAPSLKNVISCAVEKNLCDIEAISQIVAKEISENMDIIDANIKTVEKKQAAMSI